MALAAAAIEVLGEHLVGSVCERITSRLDITTVAVPHTEGVHFYATGLITGWLQQTTANNCDIEYNFFNGSIDNAIEIPNKQRRHRTNHK